MKKTLAKIKEAIMPSVMVRPVPVNPAVETLTQHIVQTSKAGEVKHEPNTARRVIEYVRTKRRI